MIGFKRGTGGVGYLRKMLDVVLFPEIWKLRSRAGLAHFLAGGFPVSFDFCNLLSGTQRLMLGLLAGVVLCLLRSFRLFLEHHALGFNGAIEAGQLNSLRSAVCL